LNRLTDSPRQLKSSKFSRIQGAKHRNGFNTGLGQYDNINPLFRNKFGKGSCQRLAVYIPKEETGARQALMILPQMTVQVAEDFSGFRDLLRGQDVGREEA
jgi:hypothetical protein